MIKSLKIVATADVATPLVVGAGIVAGTGTVAYGASNVAEAGQNIYLGYKGDGKTLAINPIRDTLFMGNDKLYHQVGGLFTTTSAVMIPIGQTQSVTKGLVEFAIGEVGGFTGGKISYYGTKLLGGSEADAQRANFVGNIIGSFAASSVASKFSLNKPIKNFKAPELMAQLANSGHKYNVDDVVLVAKNSDGKLLWLETETDSASLKYIILRHSDDFNRLDIKDISAFLDEALGLSPIKSGIGGRGPYSIYEINGRNYTLAYGDNGFIVSFYPSK